MRKGFPVAFAALVGCAAAQEPNSSTHAQQTGTAKARLELDDAGTVRSCTIIQSSGNADVDLKTCEFLRHCVAKSSDPQLAITPCSGPLPGTKTGN